MSKLSLAIRVSNLKSVTLTVLELFAFNSLSGQIDRSAAHTQHRHIHFVHLEEIITQTGQNRLDTK